MATLAQSAANQANAQFSTGPRTEEGKAASSNNAWRHGLSARDVVLLPGEREEFDEMKAQLESELKPAGPLETEIFGHLVHAAWNLRRARRLEADINYQTCSDPLRDPDHCKEAERFQRYHARTERSFHKSLKTLKDLQTQRLQRNLIPEEAAREAPPLADVRDLAKQTQIVTPNEAMRQLIRAYEQEPFLLQASSTAKRSLNQLVKLAQEEAVPTTA